MERSENNASWGIPLSPLRAFSVSSVSKEGKKNRVGRRAGESRARRG